MVAVSAEMEKKAQDPNGTTAKKSRTSFNTIFHRLNMELDLHSLIGLIYAGAIGQSRWTTSLCDPLRYLLFRIQCSGTVKVSKTNSCDLTHRLFATQARATSSKRWNVQELSFRDTSSWHPHHQCYGSESGSVGSICFWASRIYQSEIRIRILPPSSKSGEKNIGSYCFVTSL